MRARTKVSLITFFSTCDVVSNPRCFASYPPLVFLLYRFVVVCSVERKNAPGGTSRSSVTAQIKSVRDYVATLPPQAANGNGCSA